MKLHSEIRVKIGLDGMLILIIIIIIGFFFVSSDSYNI